MAPAIEVGRAATMASVRAAGDDVARPASNPSGLLCLPGKDWVACNGMFVEIVRGMAEVDSWKELIESFLKPCGTPAGSKGSPLPGGRTVTWSEEAFKRFLRGGKRVNRDFDSTRGVTRGCAVGFWMLEVGGEVSPASLPRGSERSGRGR